MRSKHVILGLTVLSLLVMLGLLMACAPSSGDTWISPLDGAAMVYVPVGDFTMGLVEGDSDARDEELPQHTVTLDAFWIDRTEVTNAQYEKCVTAGACDAPEKTKSNTRDSYYGNSLYDDYPVIYVTWYDAEDYCEWAGKRLPREAEWEKASRGTDGGEYPWGNGSPSATLANYGANEGDTTEVGSYAGGASPYGPLDMAGNVWEWVADWYDGDYYSSSPDRNPTGPSSGNDPRSAGRELAQL